MLKNIRNARFALVADNSHIRAYDIVLLCNDDRLYDKIVAFLVAFITLNWIPERYQGRKTAIEPTLHLHMIICIHGQRISRI